MSDAGVAGRPVGPMTRRRFLEAAAATGLLCLPGCGVRGRVEAHLDADLDPGEEAGAHADDASLARARDWLWSAQGSDGRFRSATYGLLATGQSLTPFALDSLLSGAPAPPGREAAVASAIAAMTEMRPASGALGFSGPAPDYPCYATGLLLSCLGAARPDGWQALAAPSILWLRGQQFRAADGWAGHPAQGGWGMGSLEVRRPPNVGHVDLSMTRRVAEGLRAVGVPATDPALVEARDFALRCQSPDGSFVYSPVELALNKGLRAADGSPRGYGSATSDGLLCLGAAGRAGSEPFERGLEWLRESHRPDRNPGVVGGPMEPFAEAMRGYYRAGAARCFARWGGPAGWRRGLAVAIAAEQREDGSVRNESALQKEDEPIIGTGFAVQALAAVLASAAG